MPRLALLAALAALAACSETPVVTDCVPGVDPSCETPPPPDEVVGGVNLTALFAAPTPAEVDAALDVGTPATDAFAALTRLDDAPDGARRFVLGLDDNGGRIASALVRVPGNVGEASPLPVVVILPDGTDGASDDDFLTAPAFGALVDGAVQVVLGYRGEPVPVGRDSVVTGRPGRAILDDVPDALALVGLLAGIPRADADRVALVGIGRGGTVALLAAPTASVEAVVSLAAVTDLFADSFVDLVRAELTGGAPDPLPAGFPFLVDPVIDLRNGTVALADARVRLADLSPARLRPADRLPAVLALHGDADDVVAPDHLDALVDALAGRAGPTATFALVEGAGHDLRGLPAVQSQVGSFLADVLAP